MEATDYWTDERVYEWLRSHVTLNCARGNHARLLEPGGCRGHTGPDPSTLPPGMLPIGGESCACPCHGTPWPPFVVQYLERQC